MEPTSSAQYDAFVNKTAPAMEQVRDDVWSVGLPMPGPYQPHYSLSYLLRDANGNIHVIDTGYDYRGNWELLVDALAALGSAPEKVRTIIASHSHPDHSALIPRLQEAGATFLMHHREQEEADHAHAFEYEVLMSRLRAWGAPEEELEALSDELRSMNRSKETQASLKSDAQFDDDDELPLPGFHLRVLTTPGHTPGSACFIDDEREIVFTGDHLLPNQFPAIGTGGDVDSVNPFGGYLDSLARLPERYEALPGHGFRFRNLGNRVRQTMEHHLRRTREVAALIAEDASMSPWEIASRLTWTAGWENLNGYARYSAVRQAVMHRDYIATGVEIPPAPQPRLSA